MKCYELEFFALPSDDEFIVPVDMVGSAWLGIRRILKGFGGVVLVFETLYKCLRVFITFTDPIRPIVRITLLIVF